MSERDQNNALLSITHGVSRAERKKEEEEKKENARINIQTTAQSPSFA